MKAMRSEYIPVVSATASARSILVVMVPTISGCLAMASIAWAPMLPSPIPGPMAPIVFWGFFGIFVGLVQAFVFSMLAVAYISSQLS